MLTERQKNMLRAIPKAENHIHIEGSIPWDLALRLAEKNHVELPVHTVDEIVRWSRELITVKGLDGFMICDRTLNSVCLHEEDYEAVVLALAKDDHDQNIIYQELHLDYPLNEERGIPIEVVMEGYRSAQKKAKEQKSREEYLDRKLDQLQKRRKKKEAAPEKEQKQEPLKVGEKARIKDNGLVGEVAKISNRSVTLIIGNVTSTMSPDKVERISSNEFREASRKAFAAPMQKVDSSITERKLNFSPELDIRGERLADALNTVMHYIDDAIMLNVGSVRIIHGKGTGVLREEIQKYLRSIPGLSVSDEDVRQGGTGVTVVKF